MQQLRSRCVKVALAVACLAVSTCAAPPDPDAGSGEVTVGVIAPREAGFGLGYLTSALVDESLLSISAAGEFLPRLIERWTRSDDGRTWRFYLKKGVRFHNGDVLTTSLILPALKAQLGDLSGAREISKIDETTFEIVQERSSSFMLDDLVTVSVATGEDNVAGTGPFVAGPPGGERIEFRAFDAYHRGTPSIREVGLQQYADQRNAWAALMRGEIDVLYEVSPEARDFVETESTVAVSSFLRPYTYLLGFHLGHGPFLDKNVRRAMNLAVDRDEIIRTALRGHGVAAYDHFWPQNWAVDPARAAYKPDRQQALELLGASAFRTLKPGRPGRMPSRLSFHCLVYAPLEKFALAIQRQLAIINVDMSIELLPASELGRRIGAGKFEAFLFELANARLLSYTYSFWHSRSPASVRTGYSAADHALDRMRYAQTPDETRAAVRMVQDIMRDDPPAIFIAYPEVARAVSRRFEIPSGEEDIFHTISRWKLLTKPAN